MKEININEIVKVESIGVIKQQLDKVEEFVDDKIKDIPEQLEKIKKMSFEEQENAKGDIKKYRTYLNGIKNELEDKRKEIHDELEKPYKDFENYYKQGVKIKLQDGINLLDETIKSIEIQQNKEKEDELRKFAEQWFISKGIENIVTFEDIGLKINITNTIKKLKDQTIDFCEKIFNDLKLIELEEHKDEILLEYKKNGFDFSKAKLDIITRKKQLEEIKKQQDIRQEEIKQEEKIIEKVEEITIPKEIIEDDEMLTVTFTITDTKENIIKVREFMKKEGIKYE